MHATRQTVPRLITHGAQIHGLAILLALFTAGCFDPELRTDLRCSPEGNCPSPLECDGERCVERGSVTKRDAAVDPPDAADGVPDGGREPIDASEPDDSGTPTQDAAPPRECSLVAQDCFSAGEPERCTVIITNFASPSEGFIGCALDIGGDSLNEPCGYTEGPRGLEDTCIAGFVCDAERICRAPCDDGIDCSIDEICAPFDHIRQDLSPYGLCVPCAEEPCPAP